MGWTTFSPVDAIEWGHKEPGTIVRVVQSIQEKSLRAEIEYIVFIDENGGGSVIDQKVTLSRSGPEEPWAAVDEARKRIAMKKHDDLIYQLRASNEESCFPSDNL